MKTIYRDDNEMYLIQKDESSGDLFLKVIVGGIAMHEVKKKMTAEMLAIYESNPKHLLKFVEELRLTS
jgi:NurA-like 5'-3' nuclease